jgi:hypothetical protein
MSGGSVNCISTFNLSKWHPAMKAVAVGKSERAQTKKAIATPDETLIYLTNPIIGRIDPVGQREEVDKRREGFLRDGGGHCGQTEVLAASIERCVFCPTDG